MGDFHITTIIIKLFLKLKMDSQPSNNDNNNSGTNNKKKNNKNIS